MWLFGLGRVGIAPAASATLSEGSAADDHLSGPAPVRSLGERYADRSLVPQVYAPAAEWSIDARA